MTDIDPDVAVRAAREWLKVPADLRRDMRLAISRMAKNPRCPLEATAAFCRLLNMIDMIDPGSVE